MKNQYFGDNKDLFKYDLVMHIMEKGQVNRFVYVPMLTEDEDIRKNKAGSENKPLVDFLNRQINLHSKNINHLKTIFADIKILDGGEQFFSKSKRKRYFDNISEKLERNSLILVDPDTGIKDKNATDQHVTYDNIKSLYDGMVKISEKSILMIFQQFTQGKYQNERITHKAYLEVRYKDIKGFIEKNIPNSSLISIDNNQIIFFFLTHDSNKDSLFENLNHYKEKYHNNRKVYDKIRIWRG